VLFRSVEEFLSLIDVEDWDDTENCWLWKGGKSNGYGMYKRQMASRIMYELVHGPIPAGKFACHDCPNGDNPSCVNPYHLWYGTSKENTQDAIRKGRVNNGMQRRKNGDVHKKIWLNENYREKMSLARKGIPKSEEHKRKIGEANGRRVWTEESRRKASEAGKRTWAKRKLAQEIMEEAEV
jgi:hypothetical protein